jgi:hypothetical protein
MWKAEAERATEGACGETRAEMGMEDWEMERREGARCKELVMDCCREGGRADLRLDLGILIRIVMWKM